MTKQEAEQVMARELEANERLLWSGVPAQGFMLRDSDALAIPFSLLWGGFAIFWEWGVVKSKAPFFFSLWGVPFVLVGLYITVGRFFVDAYQRAATAYALTDRRVLIRSGLLTQSVKSLALGGLPELSLAERADGAGTITFGPTPWGALRLAGTPWSGSRNQEAPAFEGIADARSLYNQVRAAQSALRANG
jgi:hypothetical protein